MFKGLINTVAGSVFGVKTIALMVAGFAATLTGLAAYDRFIDDPHVAALAKAELRAEVNAEAARFISEASRKAKAQERELQRKADELAELNDKLKGENDDLVRQFEATPGADDDTGIDGSFVR